LRVLKTIEVKRVTTSVPITVCVSHQPLDVAAAQFWKCDFEPEHARDFPSSITHTEYSGYSCDGMHLSQLNAPSERTSEKILFLVRSVHLTCSSNAMNAIKAAKMLFRHLGVDLEGEDTFLIS